MFCPTALLFHLAWRKSTKASLRSLKTTPLYSLSSTEVIEKGLRFSHVHVRIAICIPKNLYGEHFPASTQNELTSCCTRRYGAVRFLMWWLFLHRRLRPRQRGSTSCDMSGVAPVWLIISKGRYSFLSE